MKKQVQFEGFLIGIGIAITIGFFITLLAIEPYIPDIIEYIKRSEQETLVGFFKVYSRIMGVIGFAFLLFGLLRSLNKRRNKTENQSYTRDQSH